MISQVIFFIAVALLLLLLARRVYTAGWFGRSGEATYRFGKIVIEAVQNGSRRLLALIKNRRRESEPTGVPVSLDGSHQFWQEEPAGEQSELESHFEEGDRYLKEKKFSEAERFFLKAAASHPKDPKPYAKLGLIYLNQKNYSDAIEALKVAVKLDKYNPSRHYNLALAYFGNKDVQKAISATREAITIDPVTPKYRALLEQLLNG